MKLSTVSLFLAIPLSMLSVDSQAVSHENVQGVACEGYGPQAPRDIDELSGSNHHVFAKAPPSAQMNLCNIHFHNNAEHKAAAFSIYAGEGEHGHGGGYQCEMSQSLSHAELRKPDADICNGLEPGDTIEVHWVHSSCEVEPGVGLASCMTETCVNPDLRVETQVFTLVNDSSALNFHDLTFQGNAVDGYYQAKNIPHNTGDPVEFIGSTTGPKFSGHQCSPLQVTWSVRPECAKLDINSLGEWCSHNVFEEDHAHGVRQLVVNPELLSEIR